ncbi:MAG: MerR family transcriptional regulator [Oscillospiraceae bacterium]|nr:MerR family transcriptional regulator [Oscillospiraceae bacterium]
MELQTVSQVSKTFGISAQMLRYYERSELIQSLRKDDYAYRVYDDENIKRLQQIVILRKLQIPMKQIKDILNNQDAAEVIAIFSQNISELDEQITAISTVRAILSKFVDELQAKADVKLDLLSDNSMILLVNALSFSENKIKEKLSMDELSKASEVLEKANEKKPALILFQSRMDEFQFLGVEQVVTPDSDFGMVWDTYFKTAEKAGQTAPYSHIVWHYKNNEQVYFVGNIVSNAKEVPDGYSAVKFPACEYLVVTHEWLPDGADMYTNGIVLTQNYCGIGQTHSPREGVQMPEGYVRFDDPDSPITQIEIESKSKDGNRFERWVPIKKVS